MDLPNEENNIMDVANANNNNDDDHQAPVEGPVPENNNNPPEVNDGEEEEDDDEEEEEEDEEGDRDADGVFDAGVAGGSDEDSSHNRRRAADCDLILFLECDENLAELSEFCENPILKKGTVVSIGLDKNTKLRAVFERYAAFCTEVANNNRSTYKNSRVDPDRLEFFHCQLLKGDETAEASALMKNDKIHVRLDRSAERHAKMEAAFAQRESDREYWKQIRRLLPMWGGTLMCDLVIDCQGKSLDEYGMRQPVLETRVKGHAVVLEKRCKWLGGLIQRAREERNMKRALKDSLTAASNDISLAPARVETGGVSDSRSLLEKGRGGSNIDEQVPPGAELFDGVLEDPIVPDSAMSRGVEQPSKNHTENDDVGPDIHASSYSMVQRGENPHSADHDERLQRRIVAEIENFDDGEVNGRGSPNPKPDSNEPKRSSKRTTSYKLTYKGDYDSERFLKIILPNHPPDAVKLLLEYCYTNRVIGLGYHAFMESCRTKPTRNQGPVPPYISSRRWPNEGAPTVSFYVALAGIALAEEASMKRFSLMCEVAAARLVSPDSAVVTKALLMCTQQEQATGNPLPYLREAAMRVLLRFGYTIGIYDAHVFRNAIEERAVTIIPALLNGTAEVLDTRKPAKYEQHRIVHTLVRDKTVAALKRDRSAFTENLYRELDQVDALARESERRKRRRERMGISSDAEEEEYDAEEVYCDEVLSASWASRSARNSWKRLVPHLNCVPLANYTAPKPKRPRRYIGMSTSNGPHGYMRKRSSRRHDSGPT